jgi:hypothetical protein
MGRSRCERPVAGQVDDLGDSQSAGDLNKAVLVLHETQLPLLSALDLNPRPLDPSQATDSEHDLKSNLTT